MVLLLIILEYKYVYPISNLNHDAIDGNDDQCVLKRNQCGEVKNNQKRYSLPRIRHMITFVVLIMETESVSSLCQE